MKRVPLRYKSDYLIEYCFDPDENRVYKLTSDHKRRIGEGCIVSEIYKEPDLIPLNVVRNQSGQPAVLINGKYVRLDWLIAYTMFGRPFGIVRIVHLDNDTDNCQWQNLRWLTTDDIIAEYCSMYKVSSVHDIPEIWKPYSPPRNPNITFMVSNRGRVTRDGAPVHPTPDISGYARIGYPEERTGNRCHIMVHRMVAALFVDNPDPDNCKAVNHMDGDKQNNCFWNLEWVTDTENANHAVTNELSRGRVFSADTVESICADMAAGEDSRTICAKYGVDIKLLSAIRTGRRWKQISDKYTFPTTKFSAIQKAKIIDMIQQGKKAKDISAELGIEWDGRFNSLYERLRRYVNSFPEKVEEIRQNAKELLDKQDD